MPSEQSFKSFPHLFQVNCDHLWLLVLTAVFQESLLELLLLYILPPKYKSICLGTTIKPGEVSNEIDRKCKRKATCIISDRTHIVIRRHVDGSFIHQKPCVFTAHAQFYAQHPVTPGSVTCRITSTVLCHQVVTLLFNQPVIFQLPKAKWSIIFVCLHVRQFYDTFRAENYRFKQRPLLLSATYMPPTQPQRIVECKSLALYCLWFYYSDVSGVFHASHQQAVIESVLTSFQLQVDVQSRPC